MLREMIDIWINTQINLIAMQILAYSREELREVLNKRLPALSRWKQKQKQIISIIKQFRIFIIHVTIICLTEWMRIHCTIKWLVQIPFQKSFQAVTGKYRKLHTTPTYRTHSTSVNINRLYHKSNAGTYELSDQIQRTKGIQKAILVYLHPNTGKKSISRRVMGKTQILSSTK